MPKPCETAARKLPKRCFWNLLKTKKKGCERLRPARHSAKGRTPAGLAPKPLPNRSRKNAETSLLEPIKKKRNRAQTMRNRSQKTAETLLLEPTKNKEKRLPQARQTFPQRKTKTWKPASHQAKLKKKVFGTRMRKGRTPAGFVPKPLRNRSRKNAETSLLEPINKRKK